MKLAIFISFLIFSFSIFNVCVISALEIKAFEKSCRVVYSYQGYCRIFAYNRVSPTLFVARANSSTERVFLDLGRIRPEQGRLFTAAFSISNEMKTRIIISGISMEGPLANYTRIHLHNNSDVEAEMDGGVIFFDCGTSIPTTWLLSEGDGNYETIKNGTLLFSTLNNIYYLPSPANASDGDFVWVQIRVLPGLPVGTYSGYICIYYNYGMIRLWYLARVR